MRKHKTSHYSPLPTTTRSKDVRARSKLEMCKPKQLCIFTFGLISGLLISMMLSYQRDVGFSIETKNETASVPPTRNYEFRDIEANWNQTLKDQLFDEVKVLCWVLTSPEKVMEKAQHVAKTWGKRCNKLLFMSSETNENLDGVIALPVEEGWNKLWGKTKAALKYIYEHHLDDADWFFKADDDTYAIMENLRSMLYPYPTEYPMYFGYRFKVLPNSGFVPQGYMAGGPGYVLSKEAVKAFVEIALPNGDLCKEGDIGAEDLELGKCLANINVPAIDSRDSLKRERFLNFELDFHIFLGDYKPVWYWQMTYYKLQSGFKCCSDHAIGFHKQKPKDMYRLEYLIYQLRPFGIRNNHTLLNKMSINELQSMISFQEPEWITPIETTNTTLVA